MKSCSYNNFENNNSKRKCNSNNCICYQCLMGIPGPTGPIGTTGPQSVADGTELVSAHLTILHIQ